MKKTMKSSILSLLIAATFMFCSSCKKSVDAPAIPTSSQWTFEGTTYNPASTTISIGGNMLLLSGIGAGQAVIYLYIGTPTPANGSYTVVDGTGISAKLAANQCVIIVKNNGNPTFSSVGVAGNTVVIKLSGNKITASFSNVTLVSMANNQVTNTQNISGTLASVIQ